MVSRVAFTATLLTPALALASPASAYWSATGPGMGSGMTGTLTAPTGVSVPANSLSTVAVAWTASVGSLTPSGYYVTRTTGGTTVAACASSASTLLTGTSCTDTTVPDGAYTYRVTAVFRSWTAASAAGSPVSVWTPTKLAVTGQPGTTASGAAISPSVAVTVQTASGVTVPLAGRSVTLTIGTNPGAGTLSGTATATTAATGVATFAGLSIDKAATGYTLLATSAALTSATSAGFTITAGPASTLAITSGSIAGGASDLATSGPITVQIRDSAGNPVTTGVVISLSSNSAGTPIFSGSPNGSTNSPTLTIPAGSSSASFYYGDTKASGAVTVTASATGLTSATLSGAITAAVPAKLAFLQQPTNQVRRTTITPAITVRILDRFDNLTASTAVVTIAIENNPPEILGLLGGVLFGDLTQPGVGGVATFGDLNIGGGLLGLAGNGNGYTLKVTSGSLTPAISSAFNIS